MKKYLFLFLVAFSCVLMSCFAGTYTVASSNEAVTASSTTYDASLCEAVSGLREAQTPEEIEAAATVLEKVTKQEPNNWLAQYHLAYAYGRIAHACPNTKDIDGWVEKAEAVIKQAENSSGADISEIRVVEAYLKYAGIRVSPMMRGYMYSNAAIGKLNIAVETNGDNPRAYLLIAQHFLNVPAMLGGDVDKACEYNNAAIKKLDLEAADEGRDNLIPSWGRQESDAIAKSSCTEESTSKRD